MFYFRCIFYTFYTNTGKMITDRIKVLFNFIDYLHANIDNFNKYNELINELEFLKAEKNKLNPESNYKDKLKFNDIQIELESKFKKLQENTANPIKAKAKELEVCNFDKEPNYSFNGVEAEIHQLKENFKNEDLPAIFKHKNLYLEFRKKTHKDFLSLGMFFSDLDRINKNLFDFFKDTEQNEFETFEKKKIVVNSISRTIELFKKGYGDCEFEVNENYCLPDFSSGIFDLTLQNLVDYGLSKKLTSELLNTKGKYYLQCNEGNFIVLEEEKKVYTGIEFYRKTYFDNSKFQFPFNCPDLIPEYFDLALNEFKQEQNKLLGKIYNDSDAFFEFIKNEVDKMQKRIEAQNEYLLKYKHLKFGSKENDIKVCEAYIQYLKRKKEEVKQPPQTENNKTVEVKKSHPKHNPNDWNTDCFELFKYLIDCYYNDRKRTNTKLICIWFYLSEYNPEKYILNITKDNYLIFIKKNYKISITNKDKPDNYNSKVEPTLHEHRIKFEDSLK